MGPFVQVVLGQIISLFGNAALRFVLPLILLRQTGSAAVYGAATALALLPALAGTLAGGVLADRCRKARLMVVLDLAAAGLALGAAASADDLPVVLWAPAALCALYALQGLYQPVVRASLPLLLAGDRLVQGNAVIQLVDTLDELLGPLLGSALLGVMGLGPLLVLCGACFAASALLEWQIRIPGDRPQPRTQRKPDFAADLRESLTYLYHSRPELLRLAGIMALVNLVEIPAVVVGIPVVIVQYLGQSDAVLGAVQAVLSVGGLAGGALAGRSRHPLSDRQALGLLMGIAGLCAAMGVVLWVPPLACGGVALCGFGVMAAAMRFNVWFFARLQTVLPQAQLGRVTGCTMALASLTQPVGQAVYGVLFDVFSACPAGVLLGAGAVSAAFLTGAMRHETEKTPRLTVQPGCGKSVWLPLFALFFNSSALECGKQEAMNDETPLDDPFCGSCGPRRCCARRRQCCPAAGCARCRGWRCLRWVLRRRCPRPGLCGACGRNRPCRCRRNSCWNRPGHWTQPPCWTCRSRWRKNKNPCTGRSGTEVLFVNQTAIKRSC